MEVVMITMIHGHMTIMMMLPPPEIASGLAMYLHMFFNMCGVRRLKTMLIAVIGSNFLLMIIFSSEN